MAVNIKISKDCILVESLSGVRTEEILNAIMDVFRLDEFKDKNVIWSFMEGPILLIPSDFEKIERLVRENYPAKISGNKAALVVKSRFMKGLADKFVNDHQNRLPVEIKVFSEFKPAKTWIGA